MIDELITAVPSSLLGQSGRVFYSGRAAFEGRSAIYVLGYNPGGDPDGGGESSIADHTNYVLHDAPPRWSAYLDESWQGDVPGSHGMQPRMRHMFAALGLDLRQIPSSNLVFLRSRGASHLRESFDNLEQLCWPFHLAVLSSLDPRLIICLGSETGSRVRRRLGAEVEIGEFVEQNDRRWTSRAHRDKSGHVVLSLTHPSRADWTSRPADPSPLVRRFVDPGQ